MAPTEQGKWSLANSFTENMPKLLLVEGVDEWHLLVHLLKPILGIVDVDVRSFGGRDNISKALRSLKDGAASGFDHVRTLAVWRDADHDPAAAFQSVQSALHAAGFATPERPGEFTEGEPWVGIFILPDNHSSGSLDDLCLRAASDYGAVSHCVDGYVVCLEAAGAPLHPNRAKVKVHTYLASRHEPSLKLGEAAKTGCWNFDHEAWDPIKQFINAM